MLLEGIFAAITTPFDAAGQLYLRKLEHNVDRYSRTPLSGLVVLGSTGEAVMLSEEESAEVLREAGQAAAADKVLVAGVGQESVIRTLRLADIAAEAGYDVALVRTPHFYKPQLQRKDRSPLEMLTYYRTIADRSALPVMLYSVPAYTGYDLPVEMIAELSAHPNIIGLKDSSGSVERIAAVMEVTSSKRRTVTVTATFTAVTGRMERLREVDGGIGFVAASALAELKAGSGTAMAVAPVKPALKTRTKEVGFQVLSGAAHRLHESLQAGASGAVLALAACAPQCCHEVYTAWKEGDEGLAAEKQERLVKAGTRIVGQLGVAGVKFGCDLNGYFGGSPRLPLLPLTGAEQVEVEGLLADVRY